MNVLRKLLNIQEFKDMKLEINRENFMREKYENELDDNTKKRIKDIKDRLEK
jgi:hypothetical protein